MNTYSTNRPPDYQQYLRYLLLPPALFALGYGLAILIASFFDEDAPRWLDPLIWGCIFTSYQLAETLHPPRDPLFASLQFLTPPNNRKLALVKAVTNAVYLTAATEILLFQIRDSIVNVSAEWVPMALAAVAPVVFCIGSFRFYKGYKEQSAA